MKFIELIRMLVPITKRQKSHLVRLSDYLNGKQISQVKSLIKQKKIGITYSTLGISRKIGLDADFPQLNLAYVNKEVEEYIKGVNDTILSNFKSNIFQKYAQNPEIQQFIAPHLVGVNEIRDALVLQLFSDNLHILLLGDPGTGKTDLLRSCADIMPISSFGLGSGTTGAGLAVTVKGKEVHMGLLPLANGGLCCIDELNLMKQGDRASLYNAMEKGFVSYDKGGNHLKFDARIKLLATANPKGDRFVSRSVDLIRQQLPFEPALLSRFHVVFLIRRPNMEEFLRITKSVLNDKKHEVSREDQEFIKEYIDYSFSIEPSLPKDFENQVIHFISDLKKNEKDYLIEITPRLITGITRLVKASARMNLRDSVNEQDVARVKKIITASLKVKK